MDLSRQRTSSQVETREAVVVTAPKDKIQMASALFAGSEPTGVGMGS